MFAILYQGDHFFSANYYPKRLDDTSNLPPYQWANRHFYGDTYKGTQISLHRKILKKRRLQNGENRMKIYLVFFLKKK